MTTMTAENMGPPFLVRTFFDRFCPQGRGTKLLFYRLIILSMTFVGYTSYHLSRKPISVVKPELYNCTEDANATTANEGGTGTNCTSWIAEIDGGDEANAHRLLGTLDTSYLFAYAVGMFISGLVAERVDLRYFLSLGMVAAGVTTMLFGLGKWWGIHRIEYYIFVQVIGGAMQTTGWPAVVAVVANWFGRGKKGLIFGLWNSHTSIGNILGSLIAGAFVESDWALSFIVPGAIIGCVGVIFFFFLVVRPDDVGLILEDDDAEAVTDEQASLRQPGSHVPYRTLEREPLLTSSDQGEDDDDDQDGEPRIMSHGDDASVLVQTPSSEGPTSLTAPRTAITLWGALRIPGVIEFSLCLFFAKLVSYTFLFWLPTFIVETGVPGTITSEDAAQLSTLFDVGGIAGGIAAGLLSDVSGKSASTCVIMLLAAIPALFTYESYGHSCPLNMETGACYGGNVGLLIFVGFLVNGPYALITTAVSAELGTHPSLRGSSKALATVTAIIDGTGSIGAAVGPFLAGAIPGIDNIFYMLMASDVVALLLLVRLVNKDVQEFLENRRRRRTT